MKVVINRCFGGYSLSAEAALECYKRGLGNATPISEYYDDINDDSDRYGYKNALNTWHDYKKNHDSNYREAFITVFSDDDQFVIDTHPEDRANPILVSVVEEMGKRAWGSFAALKVVEIPDDVEWEIEEYDGSEHIAEKHRTWG